MRLLFLFVISILLFSSCKLDKAEGIPAYVKIDTLQTNLDYDTQGSNSHNFSEAWVFIDGTLQGIYDVPALFPVLETGTRTVLIRPGIKRNGSRDTRLDHPHFENYELNNQSINAGDTVSFRPVFELRDLINVWHEDFEDVGLKLTNSSNNDTDLVRLENDTNVFEGRASGYCFLANENQKISFYTTEKFPLRIGAPVYFELDYKIRGYLLISLVVHTDGSPDVDRTVLFVAPKVNAQNEAIYNKIYVSLSEIIATEPNASSFDIKITPFTDFGQSNVPYYIDNLKVLYPQ